MPLWSALTDWLRRVRRTHFAVPRPAGPYFAVTPANADDSALALAQAVLGEAYFAPNWELSYYYRGEDCNLARVEWAPRRGVDWWQTHVRGWVEPNNEVWLTAHYEPEPTEHPDAHLAERGFSVPEGMRKLRQVLEADDRVLFRRVADD